METGRKTEEKRQREKKTNERAEKQTHVYKGIAFFLSRVL
jgi:hypothetical protein